ncbi:MAG: hypothetical protein U9Q68_11225 [Euryarchaeota archaeon]|nr:hypothetical protein [Euryarchaeota archaeon]
MTGGVCEEFANRSDEMGEICAWVSVQRGPYMLSRSSEENPVVRVGGWYHKSALRLRMHL